MVKTSATGSPENGDTQIGLTDREIARWKATPSGVSWLHENFDCSDHSRQCFWCTSILTLVSACIQEFSFRQH